LIYWRCYEVIIKLDRIEGRNTGSDFLNEAELNIQGRLANKLESLEHLWKHAAVSEDVDYGSLLEAIERDLTQLTNDYMFKKLVEKVGEEASPDDLYRRGPPPEGPWLDCALRVKGDLEDTSAMKDRIEALSEKNKDQAKQYIMLKKERDEAAIVNTGLEKRLGEA